MQSDREAKICGIYLWTRKNLKCWYSCAFIIFYDPEVFDMFIHTSTLWRNEGKKYSEREEKGKKQEKRQP